MKPTFVQKLVIGCCFAVAAAIARPAAAQADPDFDAVSWTAIACDNPDLIAETNPAAVSFAGNVASSPAFYAFDADYLYFRYRMDTDPSGAHGFAQYSWTALMQVPSGNAFQYQYQLSLNGKDDTIEVWANTIASDIDFSPLFQDDAEVALHIQSRAGLARRVLAGTSFGGDADYFVDFAFPVSLLVDEGVITSAADLASSLFFPATSTNPNNYNKGRLNCTFLPGTTLEIAKEAVPATSLPANTTTEAGFVVTVTNPGPLAKGITIDDPALPSFLGNVEVTASSSDPAASVSVVSTNPIRVRAQQLGAGETITVEITGDATPTCADEDFTNVATAFAVNATDVEAEAVMDVRQKGDGGGELCDGEDNDCDGTVDENTNALCNDGNPCNGSETCGGAKGCEEGLPLSCGDGNACTVDSCVDGVGCAHQAVPGCTPCEDESDCSDGNACTTESCDAGVCGGSTTIPGCVPCDDVSDCHDGNSCTTESCDAGVCGSTSTPGCVPCDDVSDCNDGNACTTESCDAGVCGSTTIPGCVPCTTADECGDGSGCTTDTCDAGACAHQTIPGCVTCATISDCNDNNPCTDEICSENGVCGHTNREGCVPCTTIADCEDDNACTTDVCSEDGSCGHVTVPGCKPCQQESDCADGDECTSEACSAGRCEYTEAEECACTSEPEVCGDGDDNDCDGFTDCEDENCSAAPGCQAPAEVCGDCVDNDFDGLVDYEDSDCCAETMALGLKKVTLRTKPARTRGNGLNLKARNLGGQRATFNPLRDDTTLQIRDESGQLFCTTVVSKYWKKKGKKVFRFRDKKQAFAGGLKKGRFKVKKNGQIVFKTSGRKMSLRKPSKQDIDLTLRVGGTCWQAPAKLRQKKSRLVAP